MTDQQYGDCHFEVYFDSLEGRMRGWGKALRWKDLIWPRSGSDDAKALTPRGIVEPGSVRWSRCNA
jgi:hypothetical protein